MDTERHEERLAAARGWAGIIPGKKASEEQLRLLREFLQIAKWVDTHPSLGMITRILDAANELKCETTPREYANLTDAEKAKAIRDKIKHGNYER